MMMKAMLLEHLCDLRENPAPLKPVELPVPDPAAGEILIRVSVCGVCHTELDEIEGRTPPPVLPVVLGHQVVGRVAALGFGAGRFRIDDRVGVAWIHSACDRCRYCRSGLENLCRDFRATGRDVNGGYAEYMTVSEKFACRIPDDLADVAAAPLLCAGAVGYRSLRLADPEHLRILGLTGFGASGHIVLKMVRYRFPDVRIFVFARSERQRHFARELGASWVGDTAATSPELIDCIIDTTPAWVPVLEGLKHLVPGGRLVINAIAKEKDDQDRLLSLDYPTHLWMEKEVKSVANVTRRDVVECLSLAAEMGLRPEVQVFPLAEVNQALMELRTRRIRGAKVLEIGSTG